MKPRDAFASFAGQTEDQQCESLPLACLKQLMMQLLLLKTT
jgi:hypothetical protein